MCWIAEAFYVWQLFRDFVTPMGDWARHWAGPFSDNSPRTADSWFVFYPFLRVKRFSRAISLMWIWFGQFNSVAKLHLVQQKSESGSQATTGFTLWEFNIALENRPFIDGLPSKHCHFPWQWKVTTRFTAFATWGREILSKGWDFQCSCPRCEALKDCLGKCNWWWRNSDGLNILLVQP